MALLANQPNCDLTIETVLTYIFQKNDDVTEIETPVIDDNHARFFPNSNMNSIEHNPFPDILFNLCSRWNPKFEIEEIFAIRYSEQSTLSSLQIFEVNDNVIYERSSSNNTIETWKVPINILEYSKLKFRHTIGADSREFSLTSSQLKKYLQLNTLQF